MGITVLGVLELNSIAVGIQAMDAMVKKAPVSIVDAKIVCPGKFVILIEGDVASVDASLSAGHQSGKGHVVDELFIPNLHPSIIPAVKGTATADVWDAVGIIESFSVTAGIEAGDASAKAAAVLITEIKLETEMGGKSYVKMVGAIDAVEAAMEAGAALVRAKGLLLRDIIIARPHPEIKPFFVKRSEEN
jgi:microcompartment protein CcmL/EutN